MRRWTLGFDAETGSFTPGETLSDEDGETATVLNVVGSELVLANVTGGFTNNKIIYESAEGAELSSGNLTVGVFYRITARTEQDFTADGSPNNTVGTRFLATGTNVTLDVDDKVKSITNAALVDGTLTRLYLGDLHRLGPGMR